MSSYELWYFPITALGEPIRMAFAVGGVPLKDTRVPGSEWGAKKPEAPYGQMPVLTVTQEDGSSMKMAQARSILRYVGKFLQHEGEPLYPTDPVLAFKCDEVIDLVEDARAKFVPTFKIKDETERNAARLALVQPDGAMYPFFKMLDARLAGTWATGAGLSIADLYITGVLAIFEQPTFLDGFPADTFKDFPNILKCRELVCNIPALKEHYKDEDPAGIRGLFKA